MQEVRCQEQGMERLRHVLFNIAMDKLEGIDSHFQKYDEVMHQLLMTTDKQAHEMCTSLGRFIDEQGDIRKTVEELARQIDAIRDGRHPRSDALQDGTHPRSLSSDGNVHNDQRLPDASFAMQLEIEDLKTKVARLTEQSTQHTTQIR